MPSRKPSKRSGDEDVEHEPPFKFRRSVHFEDCKRDELMLTESERGQLQKVLATHDVALALVETDDESLESEDDKNDKKSKLMSKLGNTRGSRRKELKADLLRKLKPGKGFDSPATRLSKREKEKEKEKEKEEKEKVELQKLVDSLSADKLTTLIEMWGPEVDENGDYCCSFEDLSKEERVRFRVIVEQLLAEGPKEKKPEKKAHTKEKKPQNKEKIPQSDPKGSQKAKSKDAQPAKPATAQVPEAAPAAPAAPEAPCSSIQPTEQEEQEPERELTVEEMLAEFESWM